MLLWTLVLQLLQKEVEQVDKIDGKRIVVKATDVTDLSQSAVDIYNLSKFQRSNQNTCINQKPLVKVGDKIKREISLLMVQQLN
jgi:DNA-directed RNA polymerase subunit beta